MSNSLYPNKENVSDLEWARAYNIHIYSPTQYNDKWIACISISQDVFTNPQEGKNPMEALSNLRKSVEQVY